jgi:pimeloyl-ACP methyl ester carboxylesterase
MRPSARENVPRIHRHANRLLVAGSFPAIHEIEPIETEVLEDARGSADVSSVARLDEHEADGVPSRVGHRLAWHYARGERMKLTLHGSDGPLVVKLSGIAGGVRLYDEEIATAVASGFRVAALDVSGDRRDDPPEGALDWELYAGEVVEAIDRAGASRAAIWGTSFGCLIALATASRHPERVSGLLLSRPPDPLRRRRLHTALLAWAERRSHPDLVARMMFSTAFLGLTSWEVFAPALWVRLPALARASFDAATPPGTVRRKVELLLRDDPGLPPVDARIPVEIISGAWDLVAPLAGARRLASRIPGSRIHVLRFSGHAAAYTRPRAYLAAAMAALKRLT